jgi:membrane protease YdiL (CAAX protease family)
MSDAGHLEGSATAHSETSGDALPVFSYRARMVAFITYLGLMVVLRFPAPLLHRLAQHWPVVAVARLDVALNLALMPLLAGIALLALRRAAAAEAPDGHGVGVPRAGLRKTLAALGLRTRNPLVDIGRGVLGYIMVLPVTLAAAALSAWIFRKIHTPVHPIEVLEMALQTPLDHLLLMLEAAVMAPFVEETLFRGLLYPALRARWGVAGGVMASAAIFAVLHPTMPGQFLPLWGLGIALALVYEWFGSLLPGMVLHSLQNTFSTLESFLTFAR